MLLGHVAMAVAYTTAWDNYLVASGVWSYEPRLVSGRTIGWVPVEEYAFFILQTLLTGSWLQLSATRVSTSVSDTVDSKTIRAAGTSVLTVIWLAALYDLAYGAPKRRYLNLILGWALPPIMLQVAFGGDILWRYRRLVAACIIPPTLYLGAADSLAIGSGTWTINPENTIKRDVIPNLPVEELLFFFLTNVLLVFGMTLVQSTASEKRLPARLHDPYFRLKGTMG